MPPMQQERCMFFPKLEAAKSPLFTPLQLLCMDLSLIYLSEKILRFTLFLPMAVINTTVNYKDVLQILPMIFQQLVFVFLMFMDHFKIILVLIQELYLVSFIGQLIKRTLSFMGLVIRFVIFFILMMLLWFF